MVTTAGQIRKMVVASGFATREVRIMLVNRPMVKVRWRLIIVALLCATLGSVLAFSGLFISDMSGRVQSVSVLSDIPASFSDGPGYVWSYNSEGRIFGTPYASADGKPQYPSQLIAKEFRPGPNEKDQWRHLWYQLLLLDWLQQKGAYAGQIAAWTALFAAWIVFWFDYLRQRTQQQKTFTGDATTSA